VRAQEGARKSYELFQKTQRSMGELEDEVEAMKTFGVDAAPLILLLERASGAFAEENYEQAMASITEAQALAPRLKAQRADTLQGEVALQLETAKGRRGLNAKKFNEAFDHCLETRKEGDLSLTLEMLMETQRDLASALKESEGVQQMLALFEERLVEFSRIGLDTRALENARASSFKRLDALDLKEGGSLLKRALKVADKDAAAFTAARIDAVIQEALAMRLRGYPSEGVIKTAEQAGEALLGGDFASAVAAAAAGADDLKNLPPRVDAIRRDVSRARHAARLLKDGFGLDSPDAEYLDDVGRTLLVGALDDAQKDAQAILDSTLELLGASVRGRLESLDESLASAEEQGASTAPVAEALRLARTALQEGIPEAAAHWARVGADDALRAVREMEEAEEALKVARASVDDVRAFGASTEALDPRVAALEGLHTARRHRQAVLESAEVQRLAAEAKKGRVDARKSEVVAGLQRAAKLGMPQDQARRELAAVEKLTVERRFEEALRALGDLESSVGETLTRHDELQADFEGVADLLESFVDLKVDFASAHESADHAREAVEKFQLKEAEELTGLFRKEVEAILTSHSLTRIQLLVKAAGAAKAEGMVIAELEEHARLADAELKARRYREALVAVDQGLERLEDTRKRFTEAVKIIKQARGELARAQPLALDFAEVEAGLATAQEKVEEGAYAEAKVDADYWASALASQRAAEVERRLEALTQAVEEAAEGGIAIETERAGLKKIREVAEGGEFVKLDEAQKVLEASLGRKREERRQAIEAVERAASLSTQLAALEVPPSEFEAELKAAQKLLGANDFRKAGPSGEALITRMSERMKARAESALADTALVLKICAKSSIETGASQDELGRARKLSDAGDFPQAFTLARSAERSAYDSKDKHDRASQVLKFLADNLLAAEAFGAETPDVDTVHAQARDAFEFQSYEEAAALALEALGRLNARLREAFDARRQEAERRAEELEMGGAAVGQLRKEIELAVSLAAENDFVSSEVSLSGTEKRLSRLGEEFAGAKDGQERLSALIDVADLLGLEGKPSRAAADAAQALFDQGRYNDARSQALKARGELAQKCAAEVHKRLEGAGKALDELDSAGVPTAALTDLLERAAGEVIEEDFTGAFSTAREVVEGAERQRRGHEAARSAINAARRMLKVAESLEAEASSAKEMVSEAELLFRSGEFASCQSVAGQSLEALSAAASGSAGLAITEAEQNLAKFAESGVRCAPAEDSLSRSREALHLTDFLGSIRFARQASRLAEDARQQMGEAEGMLEQASRALERAGALITLGKDEREPLERARREFEAGRMLSASKASRAAQVAIEKRAKTAGDELRAEVTAVLEGLTRLRGDPAPTAAELKEADKAQAEGRALDALEGMSAARTFAREMLGETIQARTQEAQALLDEVSQSGADVSGAKGAMDALHKAFDTLDTKAALQQLGKVRDVVDGAVKAKAEGVLSLVQKASDHRFFKSGPGALEVAKWRQETGELRGQLGKGDYTKVLAGLAAAQGQVESGIANVLAERLVEIDAIREAHGGRRKAPEWEGPLFEQVAQAADRGRATLADLEAADKLDQTLRDSSSKFVTDTLNNINREMMTFEDKAAVEKLRALKISVEKARSSPASAVTKAYELLDGARALLTARAEGLLKAADRQLEVSRAIDLDASALQDFADRAHAAIQEGKVTDAIEFADNVLKESARLQEAHVRDFLKRVMAEFQGAPDGKAKLEAKRMLEESASGLKSKDFEASYDFARKALEALIAEAREAAEASIRALLEGVAQLEAEGVDCSAFRDGIEEVRAAFDGGDASLGRKRLSEVAVQVKQRRGEWDKASAALAKTQERLDRATGAKIEVGDLPAKLDGARRKLRDGDFVGAKRDDEAVNAKLADLLAGKVKALISSGQAKVKHNKNLEIDGRSADELLATAQKLFAAKDWEGAFDAAARAIQEADGAKEVTRQMRALGEKGTELLERAAEAGVTLSHEQEQVIFEAAKGRLKPGMKAAHVEELIQAIREQIGIGGARIELNFAVGEPPVVNRTNNAVMELANRGDAGANELAVQFTGDASVRTMGKPPASLEPGDRSDIELQVMSRRMGDIAVRVLVTYKDAITGESKRRTDRRWLTFFDPTDTTAVEQFVRREERCLVCVGTIPPTERLKVCECQSTFHLHCAANLKDCPKCGRALADS
jgi:hypothetical protein